MREEEIKAKRASYMRDYSSRPGPKAKKKALDKAYYEKNRDERIEYQKGWYEQNKDSAREKIVTHQKRLKFERKSRAVAELGGKCGRCGFDEHLSALHFHHRDPATKLFEISGNVLCSPRKYPWELILEEIAKCDLLCANCHAIAHYGD